VQQGVPLVSIQKASIRWSTVKTVEKTKVIAHTYGGRKPLILPAFTVIFRP
jgi:hypothetical protein